MSVRNYEEYRRQVLDSLGEDYTVEDLRNFERWRLKVLEGLQAISSDPEAIKEAVEAWLDAHPEATTTVADGSITKAKLFADLIAEIDGKADETDLNDLKSDLQDEISGTTGNIPIDLVHGKWIDLGKDVGQYVTMENGVPQYKSNFVNGWYCGMMQCSAGDEFIINGTGATAIRLYGFIDSTGKILKVASASATATDLLVTAPSTSAWIIVHTGDGDVRHSYKNKGVKKSLEELTSKVNKLSETDVVIIGDSWSDTDPEHTTYTKWPVYFEKWNKCILHNYAQNGSQVYGADDYGINGTHGGQMATAIADTTFDHNNVRLLIIEGGLNDYSHHTSKENLISAFVSLIDRGHTAFPNARIICVLNNMIFTCQNLWYYMQDVKNQIKAQTGCPAYTTFGWVPALNYISDQMHINDEGYRYFAANMLSIACGGSPTFVSNKATKENVETTSGAEVSLTVTESFTDDSLTRILSCVVSHPTGNGFANFHFAYNDGVLCSIPFYCFLGKQITGANMADMSEMLARGYSDADGYSDFAVQIGHKNVSGTFIGQQILTPNAL